MTRDEETRLINEARRGSETAFETLVIENRKNVYNLALKVTGNREDALDVSQEVFLNAYAALSSFRGESRFSVWLYRLTQNACADLFRKKARSKTVSLTADEENAEINVADEAPSPEETAERRDVQRAVRAAVDALPPDKREIIIMREFSCMSYSEIADTLGIDEGTVKSRISRSRAALAKILTENGTFSSPAPSNVMKGGDGND